MARVEVRIEVGTIQKMAWVITHNEGLTGLIDPKDGKVWIVWHKPYIREEVQTLLDQRPPEIEL